MVSSKASRMTKFERTIVENTLDAAFTDGKRFDSLNDLKNFIKKYLADDIVYSHLDEIFDCYLRRKADHDRQLLTPPSDGLQTNVCDTSPDSDGLSENSDAGTPTFDLDEDHPFPLSFYRPRAHDLKVLCARICKGNVSYISETFARKQFLTAQNQTIILNWSPVGKHEWAHTRCELVHLDKMWSCDVALAENHGTQDVEETKEEEEGKEGPSLGPQSNERVSWRPPEEAMFDCLSPEEELIFIKTATQMTYEISLMKAKRGARQSPPSSFGSDSYGSGSQQKESKM